MLKTGKGNNRKRNKSIVLNLAGSAVIYAIAYAVIPKAIPLISGRVNKIINKLNRISTSEDDWGPVIEKIHQD